MDNDKIKKIVRENYAGVARRQSSPCCGTPSNSTSDKVSNRIGYSKEELGSVPEGSNMGLGCGNPTALASLKEGEVVLDLGSGGGFDCFLAANRVGANGKVIGVDMTPEMIDKARRNARKSKYKNVEFRLGEIENLPVGDNTADIVISNCVINLSADKEKVFREAFRALKPGGRIMVSDIVLLKKLPKIIEKNVKAYVGCVSGAMMKDEYLNLITRSGFQNVKVIGESPFSVEIIADDETVKTFVKESRMSAQRIKSLSDSILSVNVSGVKPR
ncbi:MAG: arsenite methyltransferase [Nitrososphaeria archaeon]